MAEVKEAVVEPIQDAYVALAGPRHEPPEEVALLELFAGSAHLTSHFAKKGHNVLEPRDKLFGHDLFDRCQQETVIRDIKQMRPRLLWVALPCTKWSPWQRINYAHRKQQLRRERAKQRKLIRFVVDCAWEQLEAGREVALEHPRDSDMWNDESLEALVECDLMKSTTLDMCRYNLRAVTDGGRLKKPTRIVASNIQFLEPLAMRCCGDHGHTPTEGTPTPQGSTPRSFAPQC